ITTNGISYLFTGRKDASTRRNAKTRKKKNTEQTKPEPNNDAAQHRAAMGRLREKISRKNYQVSAGGFACLRTRGSEAIRIAPIVSTGYFTGPAK
ncbi:MAG: hypothetical protein ACP5O7_09855, partial [Phycisphaerae bacterium]